MATEIEVSQGALAIRANQTSFDPDQVKALQLEKAPEGAVKTFLHYAQRLGLDPFAGQMYLIPRGDKWNIQVGIGGFRTIAERTNEYQGQTKAEWCGDDGKWVDVWLRKDNPAAARIGVHRKGFLEPLYAVALWDSYAQNSSPMWKTHGPGQLAKCAEALALRKAFPMDLLDVHIKEELEASENNYEVKKEDKPLIEKVETVEEVASWTDDQINTASQLIDNVEIFPTLEELKVWYKSEGVTPYLDVPVNPAGLTIKSATKSRIDKETKGAK